MTPALRIAYEGFSKIVHGCIMNTPYPGPSASDIEPLNPLARVIVMWELRDNPELRAQALALFEGFAPEDWPKGFEKLRAQKAAAANASLANSIANEIRSI